MIDSWFAELLNGGWNILDAVTEALNLAYAWAKEWQSLLAGLLVVFAAFIFARATLSAARIRAAAMMQAGTAGPERPAADLRQDIRTAPPRRSAPEMPNELTGALEQLRSLIRSTLSSLNTASLNVATEKENGLAHFLCQRITHLQLERFPLPADPAMATRELHSRLLEQLEQLRASVKKESPVAEITEILVQLNTSARNLGSALGALPDQRLQA